MLEQALDYAKRGILVLPTHWIVQGTCSCNSAECHSPGKHPLLKNGVLEASNNPETITQWWTQWPEANIALATGCLSNIIVLDLDGPEAEEILEALGYSIPETPCVHTHRGFHYYFSHPGIKMGNRANMFARQADTAKTGLDLRGDGGYVMAPPSNHAQGTPYTWDVDCNLEDTPLRPPPPWLFQAQESFQDNGKRSLKSKGPIAAGEINDTLFRYASLGRRNGMTEDEIADYIETIYNKRARENDLAYSEQHGKRPFSREDFEKIARSAARYKPETNGNGSTESKPLKDEPPPPDDPLELIRDRTGLACLQEVIKRGSEDAQYELVCEIDGVKRNVVLGRAIDTLNPTKFRAAIWDTLGLQIKRMKADHRWDQVTAAMVAIKRDILTVDTAEMLEQYILSMIRAEEVIEYDESDPSSVEATIQAIQGNGIAYIPDGSCIRQGYILVSTLGLRYHIKTNYSIVYSVNQVASMMSKNGWEKCRIRQNKTGHLRVWKSPEKYEL